MTRLLSWGAMRLGMRIVGTVMAMVGLGACAHQPSTASYVAAEPRVVDGPGAIGSLYKGTFEDVEVSYELIARTFDSGGRLGLCAVMRVMAPRDVSALARESLGFDKSVVVLKAKSGGRTLSVPARFVEVRYVAGKPDDRGGMVKAAFADKRPGPCVVLDQPWDGQWAAANHTASLTLFTRDTRRRTKVVVGAAP